ncbi:hypothetical protein BJ878DRAFT_504648 [Calycina marina]|uniref:DNA-directed RNA polymerase subunit n=1 Tax=Calycina marina TaxID=1763456 RepID=A0A9P7Z3R2_9HELO|nr:hypothetical protein BJ878DRAFT_504648 [Calycina marina]
MDAQPPPAESKKHKLKYSKKDKLTDVEKKRKREYGDETHERSKKHKSEGLEAKPERIEAPILDEETETTQAVKCRENIPTISEPEVQAEKPKKKSKKHRSDAEAVNDSKEHGDLAVKEPKVKKSKSHKHMPEVREEEVDSKEERQTPKKEKKHKKSKSLADSVPPASSSKQHGDLPDRSMASSPLVEAPSKRSKSKTKKSKSSHSQPEATEDERSPFHTQTSSLYLPLAPISQKKPIEGLCAEHISPLILTYYPPLEGVILAYSNPRVSEKTFGDDGPNTLLRNIDEYAASWAWVTCEFLLFKPERGTELEGYINLQNEGHLGVVCWNLFSASIQRKCIPADWRWVVAEDQSTPGEEEDGLSYWVDGHGEKIEGTVKFKIRAIETSHDKERGFLTIAGTMLSDEAENALLQKEAEETPSRETAGRGLGGMKSHGATTLGIPIERDLMTAGEKKRGRRD